MFTNAPALLHVVGYLTGASLYAMLLAMVLQTRGPGYRLTLGTALLGLAWNIGELSAHLFDGLGVEWARDWMSAVSYAALGFLAAGPWDESSLRDIREASAGSVGAVWQRAARRSAASTFPSCRLSQPRSISVVWNWTESFPKARS